MSELTSPLSPNMESFGFGSCWPLIILSTSWDFLCPSKGSSSVGLKAPEDNHYVWWRLPFKENNKYNASNKCIFFTCTLETPSYLYTCILASAHSRSFHLLQISPCSAVAYGLLFDSWERLERWNNISNKYTVQLGEKRLAICQQWSIAVQIKVVAVSSLMKKQKALMIIRKEIIHNKWKKKS